MKNNTAVLVFSGTIFAIGNMAYTPTPKPAPTQEFVESTYIRNGIASPYASDKRKKAIRTAAQQESKRLLSEIRQLREQLRKQHELAMMCEKLATATITAMTIRQTEKLLTDDNYRIVTIPEQA
jgi:hypothetical protein